MKVSAGCERCYAITTAYRLDHAFKQPAYAGLTYKRPDGSLNWTGKVRMLPERLGLLLSWRKPRRIFVDSMSDLFHDDVTDEFVDRVFAVMALTPWHTYQILTKRPRRLAEYMTKPVQGAWAGRMFRNGQPDTDVHRRVRNAMVETFALCSGDVLNRASDWQEEHCPGGDGFMRQWPLPNVWLGTSVEDQDRARERIPHLVAVPAVVRFLSCEPLLGPVDLLEACDRWCDRCGPDYCRVRRFANHGPCHALLIDGIDWVIAGGESGHGYRPMDPDWARSLRDQCQAAGGVAFHFKQWGGRTHNAGGRLLDGREWNDFPQTNGAA
jgi:protein gp37